MSEFLDEFYKKTPQQKAIAFGGIALLAGFAYYKFGYSPLKDKLENVESEKAVMIDNSSKLDGDIKKFKELKLRMEELERKIEKNKVSLPSEAELPAFFETLNRKVTESGVEVLKWDNQKDVVSGEFIRVPVKIEMTGTFFQIKRFFASLVQRDVAAVGPDGKAATEDRDRVVSVEGLELTDPRVKNREIIMTAKFTASTFRQEDKTGSATTPGGKPASAAPAKPGAPAAGATPPQAAGAKVDAALKTDAQRKKDAIEANKGSAAAPGQGGK